MQKYKVISLQMLQSPAIRGGGGVNDFVFKNIYRYLYPNVCVECVSVLCVLFNVQDKKIAI